MPPLPWWFLQVFPVVFVITWWRPVLPRPRVDRFMHPGWKTLTPLVIIVITAESYWRGLMKIGPFGGGT